MYRYFAPFIASLVLLASFWLFFYNKEGLFWIVSISVLVIIFSAKALSRYYFWKFKTLWINLILSYVSQLLFLLLLSSDQARYFLSFVLSILWFLIWWLLKKYFEDPENIKYRDYLSVNKFFYYLGFWFLSTSLYSLIIFLYFPPLYALLVMLVATFFWSVEILKSRTDTSWVYLIVVLFLTLQVLAVAYFLPVSFYVAGTIATLWYFFIMDKSTSQTGHFRLYLSIFLASIIILITTSVI